MDFLPPRRRPTRFLSINLGMYNIWDGRVFASPQAIQAVQLGNYDLMLLVECLGYDVV